MTTKTMNNNDNGLSLWFWSSDGFWGSDGVLKMKTWSRNYGHLNPIDFDDHEILEVKGVPTYVYAHHKYDDRRIEDSFDIRDEEILKELMRKRPGVLYRYAPNVYSHLKSYYDRIGHF